MDTSTLIAYARRHATIEDESTEFDDDIVIELLNAAMGSYFNPIIENARSGKWLHALTRTLGSGNPYVRLHPRACALEQVDIQRGTEPWFPLNVSIESESQDWDPRAAYPQAYTVRGTTLMMFPAPTTTDLSLRAKVTVRPSVLVLEQTAGRVVAVDTTARTITVNSIPLDRVTASPMATTTVIDVIEPRGDFELSLFDAAAEVTDSSTITVGAGPSLARIEVGDYVRVANQTDWPQLPEGFHHLLAGAAAIPICTRRDMYDRSAQLEAAVSAGTQRLAAMLTPRPRAQKHMPIQHGWRD